MFKSFESVSKPKAPLKSAAAMAALAVAVGCSSAKSESKPLPNEFPKPAPSTAPFKTQAPNESSRPGPYGCNYHVLGDFILNAADKADILQGKPNSQITGLIQRGDIGGMRYAISTSLKKSPDQLSKDDKSMIMLDKEVVKITSQQILEDSKALVGLGYEQKLAYDELEVQAFAYDDPTCISRHESKASAPATI